MLSVLLPGTKLWKALLLNRLLNQQSAISARSAISSFCSISLSSASCCCPVNLGRTEQLCKVQNINVMLLLLLLLHLTAAVGLLLLFSRLRLSTWSSAPGWVVLLLLLGEAAAIYCCWQQHTNASPPSCQVRH
jgi:hypothetical protein